MSTVEREITYNPVVLAAYSKTHGPIVPVRRMRKIEVRDADKRDVVRVHVVEHDLSSNPPPVELRGTCMTHVVLPVGKIYVERVSGDNPITVLAHCERFSKDADTVERRHTRRGD